MSKTLETFINRAALQKRLGEARRLGQKIGFVPTMGALHDGHLSLVECARQNCDLTLASIFVNPTQFAPGEDLETYPRTEVEDLAKLAATGCDIVYLPSVDDMYPAGTVTDVHVRGMSDLLDGIYRPHFFYGVTTVVARLFLHVQPDIAVFGEKDFQQLQIIRRMVRDLGFPIEVIGAPTVRDPDGLAQSSRNTYLSETERRAANVISAALHRARCRLIAGVPVAEALQAAEARILAAGVTQIDYFTAVDPDSLATLPAGSLADGQAAQLLAAVWMGQTRLIDNLGVR